MIRRKIWRRWYRRRSRDTEDEIIQYLKPSYHANCYHSFLRFRQWYISGYLFLGFWSMHSHSSLGPIFSRFRHSEQLIVLVGFRVTRLFLSFAHVTSNVQSKKKPSDNWTCHYHCRSISDSKLQSTMAHVRSDKYVQRTLGYHSIQLLPSMISIVSGEDDNDDLKESKSVSMKSVIHVQQA